MGTRVARMSLRCSQHGWGIGELGCMECDEKNGTENPWSRATVQMGRASEAARELHVAFVYASQIMDPTATVKIVNVT